MMDLMDVSNEIQETLGRSYNVPDDIDEDELLDGKKLQNPFSVCSCKEKSQLPPRLFDRSTVFS